MKKLFILLILIITSSSYAENLAVTLEGDRDDTTVVVTPLDEAPQDIPVKGKVNQDRPPKWWKITLVGLGMAPVEFFISTALHEATHGILVKSMGFDVVGYHPYPHRHEDGPFRLGDLHWQGRMTPGQKAMTLAAPMFLNTVMLGTYGGLLLGDALPENRYAHLSIWVFAAGHWVDLANHFVARNKYTDTQRVEGYFQNEHGLSVNQSRLAVRGSQALVLAAGGYFLYKGFRQIFKGTVGQDKKKKNKKKNILEKHNLYIAPGGDQAGVGFIFGGRF